MTPRHATLALAAAVVALTAAPAAAGAAVTIGSDLEADAVDNLPGYCGTVCTGLNLGLPPASTAPGGLLAPFDGVVVRFRVKSGSAGNTVALRVLRPAGGVTFTGASRSDPGVLSAGPVTELPARLPLRSGESIGLDIGSEAIVWATTPNASGLVWGTSNGFATGLGEGTTAGGATRQDRELLLQAVLEPDADRDGFGDETQDACLADPASQTAPCPARPPGDTTRPRLSGLAVRPARPRLGARARIAFRVSETARVTLRFARLLPGRRVGGRCVPGSRRRGRRCTAAVPAGSVSLRAQGAQSILFDARVGRRRLAPGRYRVTVTARDAAGNVSRARRSTFTLRPARRR